MILKARFNFFMKQGTIYCESSFCKNHKNCFDLAPQEIIVSFMGDQKDKAATRKTYIKKQAF